MSTWFFLRGLVRETGHWSGFLERFEAAFPGAKAVGLDLPGNGRRFQERSPLTVGEMAEAAREEFLSRRGEASHLFALSLGGMVGFEWLRRWPGDFRSAVFANTSLRGLSPFFRRLSARNYPRILRLFLARDPRAVERGILEMTSGSRARFAELEEAWARLYEERPVSVGNALRQLFAASRFQPPREKPGTPLLLLNGAGDRLMSPRCSRDIARHFGLELRVHPGAGHDLTLDAPDWVIDQVKSWNHS
jgi:pimeloyl-ACP methyl ester carboxylesterase